MSDLILLGILGFAGYKIYETYQLQQVQQISEPVDIPLQPIQPTIPNLPVEEPDSFDENKLEELKAEMDALRHRIEVISPIASIIGLGKGEKINVLKKQLAEYEELYKQVSAKVHPPEVHTMPVNDRVYNKLLGPPKNIFIPKVMM